MFNDFISKLDPNHLLEEGSTTFLFTRKGTLYYAPFPNTHASLLAHDEVWEDVVNENSSQENHIKAMKRRAVAEKTSLLGRIQKHNNLKDLYQWHKYDQPYELKDAHVVVFWNEDPVLVKRLLQPCLRELLTRKMISKSDTVQVPVIGPRTVLDLIGGEYTTKNTPAPSEEMMLRKNLHLMPSPQKKAAMQKLGYAAKSDSGSWQDSLKKHGLLKPGQKYWAAQSEHHISFSEWLNLKS